MTPSRMFNPGLVYRAGVTAWLGYLEGLGVKTGTGIAAQDPSDFTRRRSRSVSCWAPRR